MTNGLYTTKRGKMRYAFGVKMKERSFFTEGTRYQFNGKEYDSETETTNKGLGIVMGILEFGRL